LVTEQDCSQEITLGNPQRGCIYEKAQFHRPFGAAFLSAPATRSMNLTPANKHSLKTWLVDSSGNIAVSRAGVAFLGGQITDLESKCLAGRSRIHDESAKRRSLLKEQES
jgi:hypothetical protein